MWVLHTSAPYLSVSLLLSNSNISEPFLSIYSLNLQTNFIFFSKRVVLGVPSTLVDGPPVFKPIMHLFILFHSMTFFFFFATAKPPERPSGRFTFNHYPIVISLPSSFFFVILSLAFFFPLGLKPRLLSSVKRKKRAITNNIKAKERHKRRPFLPLLLSLLFLLQRS